MKERGLTGFTHDTDEDLDLNATSAVTGLTGNPNFTFAGTSFTDFATATGRYHNALSALATGGTPAVNTKNALRTTLMPPVY